MRVRYLFLLGAACLLIDDQLFAQGTKPSEEYTTIVYSKAREQIGNGRLLALRDSMILMSSTPQEIDIRNIRSLKFKKTNKNPTNAFIGGVLGFGMGYLASTEVCADVGCRLGGGLMFSTVGVTIGLFGKTKNVQVGSMKNYNIIRPDLEKYIYTEN